MKLKLVYFAWVRERIGKSGETLDVPDELATVGDLLAHLKSLGENYAEVLENDGVIRVAINQHHVTYDEPFADADEIGLFPPMTGG